MRNWHPLTIWRYQVINQADVILLQFLLGDQFSLEEKKANYDYYEPKTTHDSSLSPSTALWRRKSVTMTILIITSYRRPASIR